MNKKEAAIIMAFSSIAVGDVEEFGKYVKQLMGKSFCFNELNNPEIINKIKEKSKDDFLKLFENLQD